MLSLKEDNDVTGSSRQSVTEPPVSPSRMRVQGSNVLSLLSTTTHRSGLLLAIYNLLRFAVAVVPSFSILIVRFRSISRPCNTVQYEYYCTSIQYLAPPYVITNKGTVALNRTKPT